MSIDALSNTAKGLLQSQKRADDLASKIVKDLARQSASFAEAVDKQSAQHRPSTDASGLPADNLVKALIDLKTEETVFRANAKLFKRIVQQQDELGRLLNEES